jgi:hypothetical protein
MENDMLPTPHSRIEWLSCPPASLAPRIAIGLAAVGRDALELLNLKYIQFRHRYGI